MISTTAVTDIEVKLQESWSDDVRHPPDETGGLLLLHADLGQIAGGIAAGGVHLNRIATALESIASSLVDGQIPVSVSGSIYTREEGM